MHNVFISYHHDNDQWYKNELLRLESKTQRLLISLSIQVTYLSRSVTKRYGERSEMST